LEKPLYNICKVAGSSLGRVTKESTRLKLKQAWLVRNFKNKANGMSFSEFALTMQEKEIQQSNRKAAKLAARLLKLESEKNKKIPMDTRLKILSSSPSAQSVTVTDLESNTTTTYPSPPPGGEGTK